MRILSKHTYIVLLFLLCLNIGYSQNNFGSEEELKKQAQQFFKEENYIGAMPLYAHLLSLYPQDIEFNFRYGVALIYAETDKKKALKYLEWVCQQPAATPESFFYLGKAYHLDFRFDEAINSYTKFKEKAPDKLKQKFKPDREIETCMNGKAMDRDLAEIVIMSKKEINDADFFRSYDVTDFGGKIIVKPDEFKSAFDKKNNDRSVIFLPTGAQEIFFSGYGEDGKNGRDIYRVRRLPNGQWALPFHLGSVINSQFDEDFAYFNPLTQILYFSSKGHKSIGGYDVFKSHYDQENNSFSPPEKLDVAVNTPDDDVLYITDPDEMMAYYSTGATSVKGNISVYKVKIDNSLNVAVIKGVFKVPSGDVRAVINVKSAIDNSLVGTFRPNAKTGDYIIVVPDGQPYKFLVETDNFSMESGIVDIPVQIALTTLMQEMEIKEENGGNKLVIRNLFDKNYKPDDGQNAIAMTVKAEKGNIDLINNDPENQKLTNIESDKNQVSSISNQDIVDIAYQDADELKSEIAEIKSEARFVIAFANKKKEFSKEKFQQSNALMEEAQSATDPKQKETKIAEANQLMTESEKLAKEAALTLQLVENLEKEAEKKEQEADVAQAYARELESAVKSNSSKEALDKLKTQKEALEKNSASESGHDMALNSIRQSAETKKSESEKARAKAKEHEDIVNSITKELEETKAKISKTRNKDEKEELNFRLSNLESDLTEAQKEKEGSYAKADKLEYEVAELESQINLASNVVDEIKNTPETDKTELAKDAGNKEELKAEITALETSTKQANENQKLAVNVVNEVKSSDSGSITDTNPSNTIQSEEFSQNTSQKYAEIFNEKGEIRDYNSSYMDQLDKAELISDELKKEETKKEIYTNWAETTNKELAYREENISKLDKKSKKEEQKRIDALKAANMEKAAEAAKSENKVSELASINPSNNENTTQIQTESGITENNPAEIKHANEIINAAGNNSNQNSNTQYASEMEMATTSSNIADKLDAQTYTSEVAASEKAKGNKAFEEVSTLQTEAFNLRTEAAKINTPKDREGALQKAAELDKQAEEKRIEAISAYSKANQAEFASSESKLKNFETKYVEETGDQALLASGLMEESMVLMAESQKIRDASLMNENSISRLNALEKANEKERLALEKQKQALDLYESYVPEKPIASEVSVNNTNTANITNAIHDTAQTDENVVSAEKNQTSDVNSDLGNPEKINSESQTNNETSQPGNESKSITQNDNSAVSSEGKNSVDEFRNEAAKEEFLKAQTLEKEATETEEQVKILKGLAESSKKKKEKDKYEEQANLLVGLAENKRQQAKALYTKANELERGSGNETLAENNSNVKSAEEIGNSSVSENEISTTKNRSPIANPETNNGNAATNSDNQSEAINNSNSVNPGNAANQNSTNLAESANNTNVNSNNEQATSNGSEINNVSGNNNAFLESVKAAKEKAEAESANNKLAVNAENANNANNNSDKTSGNNAANANNRTPVNNANEGNVNNPANNNNNETATNQGSPVSEKNSTAVPDFNNKSSSEEIAITNNKVVTNNSNTENAISNNATISDNSVNESNTNSTPALSSNSASIAANTNLASNAAANMIANPAPRPNPFAPVKPEAKRYETPKVLTAEIFDVTTESFYNAENPIPVDPPMPDGLIFKVQVGAFKNPIAQDLFRSFAPLMAENTSMGFKRYTAGMFKSFETAGLAKDVIRGNGYSDAFIVAFYNGKRISIAEARAMMNSSRPAAVNNSTAQVNNNVGSNNNDNIATSNVNNATLNTNGNSQENPNTAVNLEPAKYEELPLNNSGLLYTVQVGVYTKPVPASKIYNIQPLFVEKLPNGLLRYTSGIYSNNAKAIEARNSIRNIGVSDAFVRAYINGKPVTEAEAVSAENSGQVAVVVNNQNLNKLPEATSNNSQNNSTVNNNTNNTKSQPTAVVSNFNPQNAQGLVFTVQIGAYREALPPQTKETFDKVSSFGLSQYTNANGIKVYTLGGGQSYASANDLKNKVKQQFGIEDAFVKAFHNGKPVTISEALNIQSGAKPSANNNADSNANTSLNSNKTYVVGADNQIVLTDNKGNQPDNKTEEPNNNSGNVSKRIIEFKVQMGEYKDEVPNDVASIYLQLADKGINHYINEQGLTVYTLGTFDDYKEATKLKEELISGYNLNQSQVVAFEKGKKIPLEEALKANGE